MSDWISEHDFLENESGWCGTEEKCRVCDQSVDLHTRTSDLYWAIRVSLNATIATQRALIAEIVGALGGLSHEAGVNGELPCFCEPLSLGWRLDRHDPKCREARAALKAAKEAE